MDCNAAIKDQLEKLRQIGVLTTIVNTSRITQRSQQFYRDHLGNLKLLIDTFEENHALLVENLSVSHEYITNDRISDLRDSAKKLGIKLLWGKLHNYINFLVSSDDMAKAISVITLDDVRREIENEEIPHEVEESEKTDVESHSKEVLPPKEIVPPAKEDWNKMNENENVKAIDFKYLIDTLKNKDNKQVNLPKLSLPKFDGSLNDWRNYRDTANVMMNDNSINPVRKLLALKESCKGEALDLIKNIKSVLGGELNAWYKLTNRYDNDRKLIHTEVDRICQLERSPDRFKNIKNLLDASSQVLSNLEGIAQEKEQCRAQKGKLTEKILTKQELRIEIANNFFVRIIEQKFDHLTSMDFESYLEIKNIKNISIDVVMEFLEVQFRKLQNTSKDKENVSHVRRVQATTTRSGLKCWHCKGNHSIRDCEKLKRMNGDERYITINKLKLCRNCLLHNYDKNKPCRQPASCTIKNCGKFHHTLLHPSINKRVNCLQAKKKALMPTARVKAVCKTGKFKHFRGLIDCASEISLISETMAQRLQLEIREEKVGIIVVTGEKVLETSDTAVVKLIVENDEEIELTVVILPQLIKPDNNISLSKTIFPTSVKNSLADPLFHNNDEIHIIIGAPDIPKISKREAPIITKEMLLTPTKLGHIITGCLPETKENKTKVVSTMSKEEIGKFSEKIEVTSSEADEEKYYCELLFQETTTRQKDGRYEVRLPFVNNIELGDTKRSALVRFKALEAKLSRNENLKIQYHDAIKALLDNNHASMVTDNSMAEYVMPHHPIVKEGATTKVRPVFDASCKSTNGKSLNDILLTGDKLQTDIQEILLRFSKFKIGITTDVKKMFLQVKVNEQDRKFLRFIHRFPGQKIEEYQFNVLVFGISPAPFLAIRTMKKIVEDNKEMYDLVSNNFYVDNLFASFNRIEAAKLAANTLTKSLKKGKFELHEWNSNSKEFLAEINENKRKEGNLSLINTESNALGLQWNVTTDKFHYSLKTFQDKKFTKRSILSELASFWDSQGKLGPAMLTGKLLFQKIVALKLDWDKKIPDDIISEWLSFRDDIQIIGELQIDRWIGANDENIEVFTFADASLQACCACIYSRVKQDDGFKVTLLLGKTKIVPLNKKVTIPRMELIACEMAANLVQKVKPALKITDPKIIAFTDSQVAMAWIQGDPHVRKVFVCNKVKSIIANVPSEQWIYLHTSENPADLGTRPMSPKKLPGLKLWWEGPQCLQKVEDFKSNKDFLSQRYETNEELKKVKICHLTLESQDFIHHFCNRFSSYDKMIRTMARMKRWKNKLKGHLSATELNQSEMLLVQLIQKQCFKEAILSIKSGKKLPREFDVLSPFIDKNNIMRVGGRLQNASLPYDQQHPILIPKVFGKKDNKKITNNFTKLLILKQHRITFHAGTNHLAAHLRKRWWIFATIQSIKYVLRECIECLKINVRLHKQTMGNLPAVRVTQNDCFVNTGCDYAGPITLKCEVARGQRRYKGYICIFVCMITKAVHIEAVTSYDTQSFISAIKRFIARKGPVQKIFCDNGTNFCGADNLMKKEWRSIVNGADPEIANELAKQRIDFKYSPTYVPHVNGLFEAAVKSTKRALHKSIGNEILTYEDFSTVLAEIEQILNSRPLIQTNENIDNCDYLTPGHFTIGRYLMGIPEKPLKGLKVLNRYEKIQNMTEEFWKVFHSEYLSQLTKRFKWNKTQENLKVGQLVFFKKYDSPKFHWGRGKIVELLSGKQNVVHFVNVSLPSKKIEKKHVNDLCVLPIETIEEEQKDKEREIQSTNDKNLNQKNERVEIDKNKKDKENSISNKPKANVKQRKIKDKIDSVQPENLYVKENKKKLEKLECKAKANLSKETENKEFLPRRSARIKGKSALKNVMLFMTIICALSSNYQITQAGIIAYDCTHENKNLTRLSLETFKPCDYSNDNIQEIPTELQLIQVSRTMPVHIYQCKVKIIRTIYSCGGLASYISAVAGGISEYIERLTKEECLSVHRFKSYQYKPNVIIDNLKNNQTQSTSVTIAGRIDVDGYCKGTEYSTPQMTYTDVVVQASITVTLIDYDTEALVDEDVVLLRSNQKCAYKEGTCLDYDAGYTFWEHQVDQSCFTSKYDVLYEGKATKTFVINNKKEEMTMYTVKEDGTLFSLATIKEISVCGLLAEQTEHPKLIIVPKNTKDFMFKKRPIQTGSLDLFTYVNSKFVHIEKHVRRQMKNLYEDIIKERCETQKQILETQLTIGKNHPVDFAKLYTKQEGFTAIIAGEVVYIIKCQAVEVSIREEKGCFQELPVTYGEENYFMSPHNHILLKHGSPITCSNLVPPIFFVAAKWWAITPALIEVEKPQELETTVKEHWKYETPGDLSKDGIYSFEHIEKMNDAILFQLTQRSVSNTLDYGATHRIENPNVKMNLDQFITHKHMEGMIEKYIMRTWNFLLAMGNIGSAFFMIFVIIKAILMFCNAIARGKMIYDIAGFSWKLIAGCIWSACFQSFVYREQRRQQTDNFNATVTTIAEQPSNVILEMQPMTSKAFTSNNSWDEAMEEQNKL